MSSGNKRKRQKQQRIKNTNDRRKGRSREDYNRTRAEARRLNVIQKEAEKFNNRLAKLKVVHRLPEGARFAFISDNIGVVHPMNKKPYVVNLETGVCTALP